jgi:hypothetical protein
MQSNMDYVNNSGNKTKTAWKIMNREIGKQKSSGTIKKLSINPQMVSDESAIANAFCDYFAEATSCSVPKVKNDNK